MKDEDVIVIDDKISRARGRGGKNNFPSTAEPSEPGTNAKYLRFAMASLELPPIDISDPDQVKQRAIAYLNHCADNDRKPHIVGLANWLGVHRDTLHSWRTGECRGATHSDFIKRLVSMLEEVEVDYFNNGKVNPTAGIFLLKNHFGYKDVQDLVIEPKTGLASDVTPDEIAGKYAALPDD